MKKKFADFVLVISFIVALINPVFATGVETVPGDVIVVLKEPETAKLSSSNPYNFTTTLQQSQSHAKTVASAVGATAEEEYEELSSSETGTLARFHSDTMTEEQLMNALQARSDVLAVSPNYITHIAATPNDTQFSSLWGLTAIKAPSAWGISTGSSNVYVAVLDTGIKTTHEDLSANFNSTYSKNYISSASSYADDNGHGTHVAGIIGAVGNNGKGIVGVNWTTKLISIKVMNSNGEGTTSALIKAINDLVSTLKNNPSLNLAAINLSLGYYTNNTPAQAKTKDPLWNALSSLSKLNRTVICVASGNEQVPIGTYTKYGYAYPASFTDIDNMIVVGAAKSATAFDTSYSNYSSSYVDIAAPGTSILSTFYTWNSSYKSLSGTSMATPYVAGTVALMKAAKPTATASEIKSAILTTAQNKSYFSSYTKYGFLDLYSAVNKVNGNSGSNNSGNNNNSGNEWNNNNNNNNNAIAPTITTTSLASGTVNKYYSASISASGTTPITWSKYSGTLPTGLSLSSGGVLSGTPSKTGTFTFIIKASNSAGSTTKQFSVTIGTNAVAPSITTTSLTSGKVGSYYSVTFSANGTSPLSWNKYSGSLPNGLSFSSSGQLYGTPTKAGTFSFTLKVSNSAGSAKKQFSLTINNNAVAPSITTTSLASGKVGTYYSTVLSASGSTPLTWSKYSGNIPNGLFFSSSGQLYGTPTTAGTFTFIVKVSNSAGSATKQFSVTIASNLVKPSITTTSLTNGSVGKYYSTVLSASGSTPLTWSKYSGTLPNGLTLSSNGQLYGTPTKAGTFSFTLKVSNSAGSATKTFSITIGQTITSTFPVITTACTPVGQVEVSYSLTFTAKGSSIKWSKSAGSLPNGLSLSTNGVLSGKPTKKGVYFFTIKATNSYGSATRQYCLIVTAVLPTITTYSLSAATVNKSYSATLTAKGTTPIKWSKYSGNLPTGLSLSTSGIISGKPTKAGRYTFTAKATNSAGYALRTFTITVSGTSTRARSIDDAETVAEQADEQINSELYVIQNDWIVNDAITVSFANPVNLLLTPWIGFDGEIYEDGVMNATVVINDTVTGIYVNEDGSFTINPEYLTSDTIDVYVAAKLNGESVKSSTVTIAIEKDKAQNESNNNSQEPANNSRNDNPSNSNPISENNGNGNVGGGGGGCNSLSGHGSLLLLTIATVLKKRK